MTESNCYRVIGKMISSNRLHRKAIETVVDDIGIHRTRHQVLMNLAKRCFASQKEIAEHIGITQAAMTGSLAKLERDGLISRRSGADGRFNEISITEKGRSIIEHSKAHFSEIDNKAFDDFTEAEIEQFEKYLDKIQNNLKSILEKE